MILGSGPGDGDRERQVAAVETIHQGMGVFSFTPPRRRDLPAENHQSRGRNGRAEIAPGFRRSARWC